MRPGGRPGVAGGGRGFQDPTEANLMRASDVLAT